MSVKVLNVCAMATEFTVDDQKRQGLYGSETS